MEMIKRLNLIAISFVLVLMTTNISLATEKNVEYPQNKNYVIINGIYKVYEGENFESPETGEYFRWTGNRSVDKKFTFNIRYSVESSKFTINGDRVTITANANVQNDNERELSGFDGHLYTVSLNGWYSRSLQFSVGKEHTGTIRDLKKGGSYSVKIINNDYLEYGQNLVGGGKIES